MSLKKYLKNNSKRKGVEPVIATLLLVAIAVVGGTIIFVFSQGFFSSSQLSGTPTIEAIKIIGYDARPVTNLQADNGNPTSSPINSAGNGNSEIETDERIAIYLTNESIQKIVIVELSFAGTIYNYTTVPGNMLTDWDDANPNSLIPGTYGILTDTPIGQSSIMLEDGSAEIEAGKTVTVLIDLENDLRIGRGSQFKITTANGGIFVSTVNIGQQRG